jgi:hypothetical protein
MDFFIIKDVVLLCIGIALLIFFTLKKDKPRKVKPVISTNKDSDKKYSHSQQLLDDLSDPLKITCPFNIITPKDD